MIEYINYALCNHCSICYEICPMDVFEKVGGLIRIAREQDCETCFQCETECPKGAIYVGAFPAQPTILTYGEFDNKFVGKTPDGLREKLREGGIKDVELCTEL